MLDGKLVELLDERASHHETSPLMSGDDVDADRRGALSAQEESVGGGVRLARTTNHEPTRSD